MQKFFLEKSSNNVRNAVFIHDIHKFKHFVTVKYWQRYCRCAIYIGEPKFNPKKLIQKIKNEK